MRMLEVWPVIHVCDIPTALENARIAAGCGVAGAMLISHDGDERLVDRCAWEIRLLGQTGLRLGVNYLTLGVDRAVRRSQYQGYATWCDDPGVRSPVGATDAAIEACRFGPKLPVFAGVAFKGQSPDPDPGATARAVTMLGFIPTTSGIVTGIAPDDGKLWALRRALPDDAPLAVASGVTADNVARMVPHVTHVLVATGISKSFHEFDARKLEQLMREVEKAL